MNAYSACLRWRASQSIRGCRRGLPLRGEAPISAIRTAVQHRAILPANLGRAAARLQMNEDVRCLYNPDIVVAVTLAALELDNN